MATLTDPETEQAPSTDNGAGARDSGYTSAGLDQAESFANDRNNATLSDANGLPGYQQTVVNNLKFLAKNRKSFLLAGGGIAGIFSLILIFMALLPLKLESLIKNTEQAAGSRFESYVEKRADVYVYRYLYEKVTGTAASDAIYTNSNVFKMVYGNLEKDKFEARLKDRGYSLEKCATKNCVKVTRINGPTLKEVKSPEELEQFLDRELSGKEARSAIKALSKESYKTWEFVRRMNVVSFAAKAFRIPKLSIQKRKDNTPTDDPSVRNQTLGDVADDTLDVSAVKADEGVACMLSGGDTPSCPNVDERPNPDGSPLENVSPTGDNSDIKDTEAAAGDAGNAAKTSLRDAYGNLKTLAQSKITEQLIRIGIGETVAKTLTKSVPIVGWVALAADIDNFFWNGTIRKVAIDIKSAQYAATFVKFSSMNDQMKAGELDSTQVNAMMILINDFMSSNSAQRVYFNQDTGEKIPADQMVGSDTGTSVGQYGYCDFTYSYQAFLGKIPPPSTNLADLDYWTWNYRQVASQPGTNTGWHTPLCAVRPVLNPLVKLAGGAVGQVVSDLLKIVNLVTFGISQNIVDKGMAAANKVIVWAFSKVWTPPWAGQPGAAVGNTVIGGGQVVYNQFGAASLGTHKIPYSEAQAQQVAIDTENSQNLAKQGLIASLMNIDQPHSLGSQLLAAVPATPGGAAKQVSDFAYTAFVSPFSFFSNFVGSLVPGAHAQQTFTRNIAGVQTTGYYASELSDTTIHLPPADVAGPPDSSGKITGPDGKIDQYDCPQEKDLSKPNMCLLDVAALQGLCIATAATQGTDITPCGAPSPSSVSSSASSADTGPSTTPGGDVVALVKTILANNKITYPLDDPGTNGKTRVVLTEVAGGGSFHTTCPDFAQKDTTINIKILQFLVEVGSKTSVGVNALTDKCHSDGSKHYSGEAVDLQNGIGDYNTIIDTARKYGGTRNSETNHIHLDFPK